MFLFSCRSFTWGVDSVHSLKFNPVETNIIGSTASDRSIMLYDMRGSTPLRKVDLTWGLEIFTRISCPPKPFVASGHSKFLKMFTLF